MNWDDVDYTILIPGVYDGWSVAVMKDGARVNRWVGREGYERRAAVVDAWLAGQEPNGRWFE